MFTTISYWFVWKILPLKQGLKQFLRAPYGLAGGNCLKDTSIKTRIETHLPTYIEASPWPRLKDTSIKTRIETMNNVVSMQQVRGVWKILPLKQGLKLKELDSKFLEKDVWKILPLKQGLKHDIIKGLITSVNKSERYFH